jgi:hypothetical protein
MVGYGIAVNQDKCWIYVDGMSHKTVSAASFDFITITIRTI